MPGRGWWFGLCGDTGGRGSTNIVPKLNFHSSCWRLKLGSGPCYPRHSTNAAARIQESLGRSILAEEQSLFVWRRPYKLNRPSRIEKRWEQYWRHLSTRCLWRKEERGGADMDQTLTQRLIPGSCWGGTCWTGAGGTQDLWLQPRLEQQIGCPMARWRVLQTRRFHGSVYLNAKACCLFCAKSQRGNLGPRVVLQMAFKEGER